VLLDRFCDSTLAYQGYGRGLDLTWLHELNKFATDGLSPDLTVLLDVEPETGMSRCKEGSDRMESMAGEFHRRVREGYLLLAENEPKRFKVFNAAQPLNVVIDQVWFWISSALKGKG